MSVPDPAPPGRRIRLWPWVVLAVVSGVGFALHSPWLSLRSIEIVGAVRSDPASRVEAGGVGHGAILVWIDTGALEASIAEDPWVSEARVTRVWPDRLVVEVLERSPAVWIEGQSAWMLVAGDGMVLQGAPTAGGGLLRAAIGTGDHEPGERPEDSLWREVVVLAGVLRDDIGGTMTLRLQGTELWSEAFGHPVRFGTPVDLADKGRALRALLQQQLPVGATVDVSAPLRPVVVPLGAGSNPGGEVEGSGG